jgi:uncharacterized ion transporter superfamily protein YfcC
MVTGQQSSAVQISHPSDAPAAPAARFPHPMVLLVVGVLVAAMLTWVLPAGEYERVTDAATGRELVVPGTWHRVEPAPVGPAGAMLAVPRGIVAGADVVVVILMVGGAFALLEGTGALARLVGTLVGHTRRPPLVVAGVATAFATLGALNNLHEEIIALVPVLLVLSRGLGYGPLTALGMSVGAAVVGSAFSPFNPFAAGIANRFAGLPVVTDVPLRLGVTIVAVLVWIAWTLRQASRELPPPADARDGGAAIVAAVPVAPTDTPPATRRDALLAMLATAGVSFPRWLRYAVPGVLLVLLVGFAGMALAM